MSGIAVFLMISFFRQYRIGTKSRHEAAEAYKKHKTKKPVHSERLAKFDRIIFDVISKRKSMSKDDYDFLMESITVIYTDKLNIKEITEHVNSLYKTYGKGESQV